MAEADDLNFGNHAFIEPYIQMQKLLNALTPFNIKDAENVDFVIAVLEHLEDLFWSFFQNATTVLSQNETNMLFDLYNRQLLILKQNEGLNYHKAEKAFQCCRNLAVFFLEFVHDWYG